MAALVVRGAGPSGCARFWMRVAAPSLLCLLGFNAAGQDTSAMGASAYARSRVELSSSTLPLFDSADGARRTSRLDMIWLPPRHPNLGLAFGLSRVDAPGFRPATSGTAPTLDLGFQWRYTFDSQYRIDITAWRRVAPADALSLVQNGQPDYGARVEMRLGASPSNHFVAERGFVGLQLESGARIAVRRNAGHPMLYYRGNF